MPYNTNLKKYMPISELDKMWGFIVQDIGHTVISKNSVYPSKGHPGSYMFQWDDGRILNEYHFVLITEGSGIFESKSAGINTVNAGDGFMIFPGEWHRYKPDTESGWTEYWIGFTGEIADIAMKDTFFSKQEPVIRKCGTILAMNLFNTLFQLILEEPFGYQRTASGVCLQLLAELCNIQKRSEVSKNANSIISKAKHLMHKQIDTIINFQTFCKNNNMSYSKFRVDFKNQTGFAPLQYFLLMKIEKAKDLLIHSRLSGKQIAYNLGFKTDHYFNRVFKQKTGFTPQEFKTQSRQ